MFRELVKLNSSKSTDLDELPGRFIEDDAKVLTGLDLLNISNILEITESLLKSRSILEF